MPLVLGERVLETSTTTGTSAFTLNGATVGFQSFFDKVGNGNTCYYTIRNRTVPAEWETGIGTISGTSASGILTRTTILSSSTGSAVSFSAGTKDIFDTLPASKSVYTDTSKKLLIDTTTSLEVETTNLPISVPSLNLDFARSKQLDPRITFGRLSAATYYDGQTTAMAEQNLLLWSQDFDNASWTKTNGTVTANAIAAPDGTTTAELFTENTTTGIHDLTASGSSIANQQMVFSAFIKPNGRTIIRLDWLNNDGFYVLATLTGSGTINNGSGTITALANGWYRLALITTTTLAAAGFRIKMCESVGGGLGGVSYTGDGTSGIYIWGAQLEQRSSVTAYTPTTTSAITNYIPVLVSAPSNVPRFDHDSRPSFNATATVSGSTVTLPTTFADGSSPSSVNNYYKGSITVASVSYPIVSYKGSTRILTVTGTPTTGSQAIVLTNKNYGQSLGLLIEEGRTNLFTYSSDFVNRSWSTATVTITPPTIIAPDGTLTGVKWIPTNVSAIHSTYTNFTTTSGVVANTFYTHSFYAKKGGINFITVMLNETYSAFNYSYTVFNLATGTASILATGSTTNTYTITPVGNDWYRCTITDKTLATNAGAMRTTWYVGENNNSYTGDGYSGVYIWGAQLEAGSCATSYIPTPSSSTVTRQPDVASMTGTNFSSWFNNSEGSFSVTGDYSNSTGWPGFYTVGGISCFVNGTKIQIGRINTYDAGHSSVNVSPNTTISATIIYVNSGVDPKKGNLNFAVNGVYSIAEDAYLTYLLSNASYLYIGYNWVGKYLNGHIRKLTYYPQALSSSELQGLTK